MDAGAPPVTRKGRNEHAADRPEENSRDTQNVGAIMLAPFSFLRINVHHHRLYWLIWFLFVEERACAWDLVRNWGWAARRTGSESQLRRSCHSAGCARDIEAHDFERYWGSGYAWWRAHGEGIGLLGYRCARCAYRPFNAEVGCLFPVGWVAFMTKCVLSVLLIRI